jgi:hypothetical protein
MTIGMRSIVDFYQTETTAPSRCRIEGVSTW